MNNKKNKNKGRSKPITTIQGAESNKEKIDNVESNINSDSKITEESRVPEIVNETIAVVENEMSISDTPKKPKRSKSKKKKEAPIEDNKTEEEKPDVTVTENSVTEEVATIVPSVRKKKKKSKKQDEHLKENLETTDLKCSKQDCDSAQIIELAIDKSASKCVQNVNEKIETAHKDDTNSKKKRKKKHCHDFEKKDVLDPCTLAFQKLVDPPSSQAEAAIDNDSVHVEVICDDNVTKVDSDVQVIDLNDAQKRHEKLTEEIEEANKEYASMERNNIEKLETSTPEVLNESVSSEEVIFVKNNEGEKSPKPKAKIAKPVQKKRKSKQVNETVQASSSNKTNVDYNKCYENELLVTENIKQTTDIVKDPLKDSVFKEAVLDTPEIPTDDFNKLKTSKIDESFISEELQTTKCELSNIANITVSKQEKEIKSINNDNLGFVEVKTSKSKKKKSKSNPSMVADIEVKELSGNIEKVEAQHLCTETTTYFHDEPKNIEERSDTSKEFPGNIEKVETQHLCAEVTKYFDDEPKNIEERSDTSKDLSVDQILIPDLIEYPRSTSQQYNDDNNNTIIQEILIPDEIRLANPIFISTPTIQGSGESPEVEEQNNPVTINITEIIAPPDATKREETILQRSTIEQSVEKTDIKSKMIEINKDMEELRLSIERSLAELTAIEKSDTEVDKKFEELFQGQINEQPTAIDNMKTHNTKKNNRKEKNSGESEKSFEQLDLKTTETLKVDVTTKNVPSNDNKIDVNKVIELNKEKCNEKTLLMETHNVVLINENTDNQTLPTIIPNNPPVCPVRRDKGKNKSKKKDKKGKETTTNTSASVVSEPSLESSTSASAMKSQETEKKMESSQEKGKQQTADVNDTATSHNSEMKSESTQDNTQQKTTDGIESIISSHLGAAFEPIENFEDALTSSADDINNTFEMIASDANQIIHSVQCQTQPQINIISPPEETKQEKENNNTNDGKTQKENPISRPKNLLGHPDMPVSSNKNDFKKEKYKPPNSIQANVKIKDTVEIEKKLHVDNNSRKSTKESYELESTYRRNMNDDLIYKYSFRKVFIQNICHVCKKDLVHRLPCQFCSLIFYCSQKHKDEDWPRHQSLCFAVSTIAHLKEQKHIYANTQNILGHHYRLLRMQTILSCEKVLNRKLVPWEQEAMLYPRICSDVKCRQWKQGKLKDCEGCGQISYCADQPEHLPQSHQRWCKSYALYKKLVNHQLAKGRLEPRLPTKVLKNYHMPEKINDVLASMYEVKIDIDDIQYAALMQIATAPLTAAYCYQHYSSKLNSTCANGARKKPSFTIHIVGAELAFEVDVLNKWEIFLLHLRSDIQDLRVVMVGPDLNSSKLPLDLLRKIQLCDDCQANKRRLLFDFHGSQSYDEYYQSEHFITPDIVCAFNSSIQRLSLYNTEMWPSTINCILKQRVPFVLTSYTIEELRRDLGEVRKCARVDFNVVSEIKHNPFCSVRPDRNFITDHEIPLLFKNYTFCILCGTF